MTAPAELLHAAEGMTRLERCHFLAQCAHESAGFTRLVENLNYSVTALQRTWPSRFPPAIALDYANHPERIANRAYANRLGNDNEASGDGWRYRGAGYIQITGKDNFANFSRAHFGDDRAVLEPGLLQAPAVAAAAARWFWDSRHLGIPANKDDLVSVTRGINGGLTGLADRAKWLATFKAQSETAL